MLYQIYEAQRSLMEPFADFAQAAAKLYSNPLSPLGQTPLAQRVAAGRLSSNSAMMMARRDSEATTLMAESSRAHHGAGCINRDFHAFARIEKSP